MKITRRAPHVSGAYLRPHTSAESLPRISPQDGKLIANLLSEGELEEVQEGSSWLVDGTPYEISAVGSRKVTYRVSDGDRTFAEEPSFKSAYEWVMGTTSRKPLTSAIHQPGSRMAMPQITGNGTKGEVLQEYAQEMVDAVRVALDTLIKRAPHARDYQVKPEAYALARDQHHLRVQALQNTLNELEEIRDGILDQLP